MRDRRRGREREEKGTRHSSQDTKGIKRGAGKQNIRIIEGRVSGLYRERPWAGELRVEGRMWKPYPVTRRD